MTEAPLTERRIQRAIFRARLSQCRFMLPNFTPIGWHECDMWLVTKAGFAHEYEIKLSVADFLADAAKLEGWPSMRRNGYAPARTKHERLAAGDTAGPIQFWYVAPEGVLAVEQMPTWAGLIESRPGNGWVRLFIRRRGPRLHGRKTTPEVIQQAMTACYWRFWQERNRLDDLREAETARD